MLRMTVSSLVRTCLLFACVTGGLTSADDVQLQQLSVGFDGVAKVGRWLPFDAEISKADAADIELRIRAIDPRGDTCEFVFPSESVPAGLRFRGSIRIGRLDGSVIFDWVERDSERSVLRHVISHSEALGARIPDTDDVDESANPTPQQLSLHKLGVPYLLTVGPGIGVPEMLRNASTYARDSTLLDGAMITADRLPAEASGLDGVDILVIGTDFNITEQQARAVQAWTEAGGRLMVVTGKNVGDLCSSRLGPWLQTAFEIEAEPSSVREIVGLQNYVPRAQQIETNFNVVPIAVVNSPRNVIEINGSQSPILVRQSFGLGTVDLFCVDLNASPIDKWPSLPQLYEQLIFGERLSRESKSARRSGRISQTGISDLATQLMAGVDAEPSSGGWSTWSVMALLAAWLLLIGPLDYYIAVQLLKKPHLTWVTFPLLIALGIWLTTRYVGTDADRPTVVQLDMVNVYPSGQSTTVDTRTLVSVSSHVTQRLSPTVKAAEALKLATDPQLTWAGRPEDVFGGLYRNEGIGFGKQVYQSQQQAPASLDQVPLLIGGSRQFASEWKAESPEPLVTSQLSAAKYGQLRGSFSHQLPAEITDFLIVFRGNVYRQMASDSRKSLKPGEPFELAPGTVQASDLKAFLNGVRTVKAEQSSNRGSTQVNTAYQRSSRDPLYILTMVSLFDAAGGSDYVGLTNSLFQRDDLSDTVRLNHALLIGQTSAAATDFQTDDAAPMQTDTTTIVRLLMPVEFVTSDLKSSTASSRLP